MSDLNDIVAVGLDLKPQTLIHAYSNGIFPWPSPGLPLLWHCPLRRGVLLFEELHISKRLRQYLKKANWTFTIDQAFIQVIEACSFRGEEGTWITAEMKDAYLALFQLGHAHSIEVWNGRTLVGGLYGVDVAGSFAGESMFHREDHAAKAAFLFVVSLLKKAGRQWIDIQMVTPHMEALGAREISREKFLKKLGEAKKSHQPEKAPSPFLEKEKRMTYAEFSTFL